MHIDLLNHPSHKMSAKLYTTHKMGKDQYNLSYLLLRKRPHVEQLPTAWLNRHRRLWHRNHMSLLQWFQRLDYISMPPVSAAVRVVDVPARDTLTYWYASRSCLDFPVDSSIESWAFVRRVGTDAHARASWNIVRYLYEIFWNRDHNEEKL